MKTAQNPSGQTIYFDEDRHRYFCGDIVLTSVTTWVGSFFPKFNAEKVAKGYAKKNGKTPEYWMEEWAKKGEDADELGTNVHGYAEHCIEAPYTQLLRLDPLITPEPKNDKESAMFQSVDKAITELRKRYRFISAEAIVFSLALGIAGTIDFLAKEIATGDILIGDWKTNQKIDKEDVWRTAFPPISSLDDCNFNKYALQVNMYEKILTVENYFPGRKFKKALFHITEGGAAPYKVGDMQGVVDLMLEWI